jgi:hypothetical protein
MGDCSTGTKFKQFLPIPMNWSNNMNNGAFFILQTILILYPPIHIIVWSVVVIISLPPRPFVCYLKCPFLEDLFGLTRPYPLPSLERLLKILYLLRTILIFVWNIELIKKLNKRKKNIGS